MEKQQNRNKSRRPIFTSKNYEENNQMYQTTPSFRPQPTPQHNNRHLSRIIYSPKPQQPLSQSVSVPKNNMVIKINPLSSNIPVQYVGDQRNTLVMNRSSSPLINEQMTRSIHSEVGMPVAVRMSQPVTTPTLA